MRVNIKTAQPAHYERLGARGIKDNHTVFTYTKSFCRFGNEEFRIFRFPVLDSTNSIARNFASGNNRAEFPEEYDRSKGYIFIADEQTAGRGRLGRRFVSDNGVGLYASFLFSPKISADRLSTLTAYAAVCTARAIERLCGGEALIKWVNDIYIGGKKAAGILTEGAFLPEGEVDFVIVGIGVNLKSRNFGELSAIATSLEDSLGTAPGSLRLAEEISKELFLFEKSNPAEYMAEYRRRNIILGKAVRVTPVSGEEYIAVAKDISLRAELTVERGGESISLSAADVSLHLQ